MQDNPPTCNKDEGYCDKCNSPDAPNIVNGYRFCDGCYGDLKSEAESLTEGTPDE